MKTKTMKLYTKVLSFFLVLLGFSSCSDDNDDRDLILMYGVPSTSFKVSGSIVSETTKEPVRNIRAILVETYNGEEHKYGGDTVYSNVKGEFELTQYSSVRQTGNFNLKIDDVDGAENGKFDSKIEKIKFDNPESKWEVEKNIGKIEITPTKPEKK